ncbi:MAG: copper chaperone PCu(A)C [Paracoccaceae bacterium]|jgi:hypothetical protein|nr:copper chaperone PCu(A)C [Paracoccaceae bacterium]MDP7186974.1 copper chaperone PCu(A)C [Paracoccaceae bacterium]
MKPVFLSAVTALMLNVSLSAPALAGAEDIIVDGAWSRASIGTSRPGVAYMTIRNTGDEPVTLTEIRTEIAMMPEIHRTSTNEQGVSSMTPAGEIKIEPGETVALEPGGLHAMLMRLQRPMAEGESYKMTLVFSGGGEVVVEVPILGVAARGPEG